MRLVDFGCGAGSLTCGFARLIALSDVLGLDMPEAAIGAFAESTRSGRASTSGYGGVHFLAELTRHRMM
jgi:precorrin-6B methylase 2